MGHATVNYVALSVPVRQNSFLNTTIATGNSERDLSWFSSASTWKFRAQSINLSHRRLVRGFFQFRRQPSVHLTLYFLNIDSYVVGQHDIDDDDDNNSNNNTFMSLTQKVWKEKQVLSLTKENAVDLYNRDDGRRKHTDPFKHKSLSLHGLFLTGQLVTNCQLLCLNSHTVKCTHSSGHIEHYKNQLYYVTRTKHDCISVRCVFNWNTSVTGRKHMRVDFTQPKLQPIFTANSSVSDN